MSRDKEIEKVQGRLVEWFIAHGVLPNETFNAGGTSLELAEYLVDGKDPIRSADGFYGFTASGQREIPIIKAKEWKVSNANVDG